MKKIIRVLLIISLVLLSGCGEEIDNKNQGNKIINENNEEYLIPANNTVTPINNTSSADKLNDKGVTVIENQSFQTKLENWGEVRFVSAFTADGRARLVFFLVDSDDNILYEFPGFSGNTWAFFDMLAVAFKDVNNDGLEDIIIIAEYITGVGENGATPFNVAGIYFQKDKEFTELPELDRELNDNSKNQTIDMVIEYLNGREIKIE